MDDIDYSYIDDDLDPSRSYSRADIHEIADAHGVQYKVVKERLSKVQGEQFMRGCFRNVAISIVFVILVAGYFRFATNDEIDNGQVEKSTKEQYDSLPPEGQRHVDEQMRKYDEFCAKNPGDC